MIDKMMGSHQLKPPLLLPVIHVESEEQALRNAQIAYEAGCGGVFLINHDIPYTALLEIHHTVYQTWPEWWIGVNCLDLEPAQIFGVISEEVAGVWVDNAKIVEQRAAQPAAEKIQQARQKSGWSGLYFGGVAFKYQRAVADVGQAARLAGGYMDVVTTSGPGTGQAARREKIAAMKAALGEAPLALASGISLTNIDHYLGLADYFLVATSISKSWTELDPGLVGQLAGKIAAYRPS